MKKMQCDVCGSIEIKKIAEDIFECQSCGVQYSNEEVKNLLVEITGNVKIDHSDEVKNAIKRGEQYENTGNVTKAIEYYDRALDIDADNEEAQRRVQNAFEAQNLERYYIIEPTIDPEKNVEDFLKQLATADDIACDIYKEISINSVTEKYNTFLFIKNKCRCDWSATICYRNYENVTVYENRFDFNLNRDVKTPVTKKVERIDRVPRSGTYSYESDGLTLGSDAIRQRIGQINEIGIKFVLENFETLQDQKYSSYLTKKIDTRNVTKNNDKYFYNSYELDLEVDNEIYKKQKQLILERADENAADTILGEVGGDFSEGWQATRTLLSHTVAYVCIPVQIIEYSYKGQNYVAISDLISQTTSMPFIYPCDNDLADAKKTLNRDNAKSKKTPVIFSVGAAIEIISFLLLAVAALLNSYALGITSGVLMVVALVFVLIGDFQRRKLKKQVNHNSSKLHIELYHPRMAALSESYEAFFKAYSGVATVDAAAVSANVNSLSIANTDIQLSPAGKLKMFSLYSDNDMSEYNKKICQMEDEISKLKKKRVIGIVLAVVSCIIIIPLFIAGMIITGNTNRKIIDIENKRKELQDQWLKS